VFGADFLELFGPDGNGDLSKVRRPEQVHESPRLADSAADTQGDPVVHDRLVIWKFEVFHQIRHLELLDHGFFGDSNTHGGELMPSPCDRVPDQDVPVEPMGGLSGVARSVRYPIVIVGGSHLMRIPILEWVADANDENGRIFLEHESLALFARQVGIHVQNIFSVKESQFFGKVRVFFLSELGVELLDHLPGAADDLPDFLNDILEKIRVALLYCHHPLPVPLVDISAMVVVEEVVLAHRPHVGADALTHFAAELGQSRPFPFRRGLDDLGVEGLFESESAGELDGRPRTVAVQHIIDSAFSFNNQWHLNHGQVQFFAQVLLNVLLNGKKRLHTLEGRKNRLIIIGQDFIDFRVGADPGSGQVRFLVSRHFLTPSVKFHKNNGRFKSQREALL
jgi:hypothetical protein